MDKILVVVDMQNDFIDGSLGTAEARKIVPKVVSKIEKRRTEGYGIVLTMDTHTDGYLASREGKNLPIPHCIKGTHGWELNEKIAEAAKDCKIYEKETFLSCDLMRDLQRNDPGTVEIVGLCTDVCVVSNALGIRAFLPEARVAVDAECCAGVTPDRHISAIETMKSCQIEIE